MTALRAGDPGFADEIVGYNRLVEHTPALVVAAESDDDIVAAVRYAKERSLSVGVLCTGHGPSVPADGVLVTTRRLRQVRVDPEHQRITVQAGALARDVTRALAPHGQIMLGGSSPDVGVVGYHLGGGLPLLGRAYGFAADRVQAMTVVTADGIHREITAQTEPELFWAILGCRGNFGIVTSLTTQTIALPTVIGGGLWFTGEEIGPALHAYRELTDAAPDTLCTSILLMRMPDLEPIPEPIRGRRILHVRITSTDLTGDLTTRLRDLRGHEPVLDTIAEIPTSELASIHAEPPGPVTFEASNSLLGPLDRTAIDTLLDHAGADGTDDYLVELRHLGGALRTDPAGTASVGRRDATFVLYAGSRLGPLARADAAAAQTKLHAAMSPWGLGAVTPAFLSGPDATTQLPLAFGRDPFAQLRAVKATWDPDNLFRVNHNVSPR